MNFQIQTLSNEKALNYHYLKSGYYLIVQKDHSNTNPTSKHIKIIDSIGKIIFVFTSTSFKTSEFLMEDKQHPVSFVFAQNHILNKFSMYFLTQNIAKEFEINFTFNNSQNTIIYDGNIDSFIFKVYCKDNRNNSSQNIFLFYPKDCNLVHLLGESVEDIFHMFKHTYLVRKGNNRFIVMDIIKNEIFLDFPEGLKYINNDGNKYFVKLNDNKFHFFTGDKIIEFSRKPNEFECCVCLEKILQRFTLIPCGHTNVCENCIDKLEKCPNCRIILTDTMKIF
tara:strand:+ start:783 stop:1622 length:840 start_codon:yes stop_codon:yes gene_type:complete